MVSSKRFEEAREVGKRLLVQRLIDGASGNMSFREEDCFYITRTGVLLDDLDESSFVKMRVDSDERDERASSDQLVHREVYRRSDLSAVLHCHGVFNVVLSFIRSGIMPLDLEGRYFLGEVRVINARFGSEEMAEKVAREVAKNRAVIVRGHGIYCGGKSLEEAYRLASYLEHSCEIIYRLLLIDR